jgi:hypothetical protein
MARSSREKLGGRGVVGGRGKSDAATIEFARPLFCVGVIYIISISKQTISS